MKLAAILILSSSPAIACDWTVSERIDPMTDAKVCNISSPTVKLGVGVRGDVVTFVSSSAYKRRDFLTVRVDDNEAMQLSDRGRSTDAFESDARDLLSQIREGKRLRVQFRDVDGVVNGYGKICNLPALIDACAK